MLKKRKRKEDFTAFLTVLSYFNNLKKHLWLHFFYVGCCLFLHSSPKVVPQHFNHSEVWTVDHWYTTTLFQLFYRFACCVVLCDAILAKV